MENGTTEINETATNPPQNNPKPEGKHAKALRVLYKDYENLIHNWDEISFESDPANKASLERRFEREFLITKTKIMEIVKKHDQGVKVLQELLTWERHNNRLDKNKADWYLLNDLDLADCTDEAQYFERIPAGAFYFAVLGEKYKYSRHYSEDKGSYIYTTFIPRVVSPEEQMTKEIERKRTLHLAVSESDWPEEKILIHRFTHVQSEWKKYFRHVEK